MEQNAFVEKKITERSSAKKTVTIADNDDVISKVGQFFILVMKDILSHFSKHQVLPVRPVKRIYMKHDRFIHQFKSLLGTLECLF